MSGPGDVPTEILDALRVICRSLPEIAEEPAWTGIRWRIRARTVAHVYTPDPVSNPFYADYLVGGEPPAVVTFRVPVDDVLSFAQRGFPYFVADWGDNVIRAILGDHTDWDEVGELITDSYCEMAPKFLAARVVN